MKIYTTQDNRNVRVVFDNVAFDVLAVANGSNKVYIGTANYPRDGHLVEVTAKQKQEIKERLQKIK